MSDSGSPDFQPYQYPSALQPGYIRLLQLIPRVSDVEPPNFKFRIIALPPPGSLLGESQEAYMALSYVWGDSTERKLIRVDGQNMFITNNLYTALMDLTPELQTLPIWADAACIQQEPNGNPEKKAQLDRMGDVYRYATKVLVHLGDYRNDDAVRIAQNIGQETFELGAMIFRNADLARWPDFEGQENQVAKIAIRQNLERKMNTIRGGIFYGPSFPTAELFALFDQPWFCRAWILQELALARDETGSVIFACGPSQRVMWEHLWGAYFFMCIWIIREAHCIENASGFLQRKVHYTMFKKRLGIGMRSFDPRAALTMGIRKQYIQHELSLSLKKLLIKVHVGDSPHASGCRDRVDKVNAIASMSNEAGMISDIRRTHDDWKGYYTTLTKRLIEQGHIDLLSICRHRHPELPSWVVDWSRQQWPPWLGFKNVDADDNEQLFDAARGTSVRCHPSNLPSVLKLEGFFIDTVMEVSRPWPHAKCEDVGDPKFYTRPDEKSELNFNEDLVHRLKPINFGQVEAKLRLAQIGTVFLASEAYTVEQKKNEGWRVLVADKEMNAIFQVQRATDASRQEVSALMASLNSKNPAFTFSASSRPSAINVMLSFYGSRILTTEKQYVGLCHFNTAAKDRIFIPSGSHCPYAVRPTRTDKGIEGWRLLGEVYLYGIMDGELKLAEKTPEIISLV